MESEYYLDIEWANGKAWEQRIPISKHTRSDLLGREDMNFTIFQYVKDGEMVLYNLAHAQKVTIHEQVPEKTYS